MASTLGTHPYDYQKASTLATRALVSETKPSEIPSSSSHDFHFLTNKDTDLSHPTTSPAVVGPGTTATALGAGPPATNNYHQASTSAAAAAAEAAKNDGLPAGSGAMAQRRQSWNPSDLKREAHEKLLEAGSLKGYHSSGGGGGGSGWVS
ncbi:hypothetical protein KC332_g11347 [Hortaea werneckii]|uniref:SMP domain-containing protein n=2 Tax=Hortaea werneckii TaxID=91943 RepID=A0A3M7IVQ1_HORWE|nr:hypothetical protein KC358_g7116 [Hortaea werneckii]OTA23297.1 hypothetical protein BTJ68_13309 [Hortaea werneckii EXF-2000]KAI6850394.1 hypothetical protein KC350_g2141 [Hortaea werneckii]KAI6924726.1 hypothetical protein KC348_g9185 [Hortaea werneckii]KAI6935329.1 hypothetical protein KC341_g6994 [Hortaea werneckii]